LLLVEVVVEQCLAMLEAVAVVEQEECCTTTIT
jgi:hypothetical protein